MQELLRKFDDYCRETIKVNTVDFSAMFFKDDEEKDDFVLRHFASLIDIILEHLPGFESYGDQHLTIQLKLIAYQHLEDYKLYIYKSLGKKGRAT